MLRQSVSSADLKSAGYDNESSILEIEFNSGGVYQYFDVPEVIYLELMNAASHGKYFHQNILNKFRFSRV